MQLNDLQGQKLHLYSKGNEMSIKEEYGANYRHVLVQKPFSLGQHKTQETSFSNHSTLWAMPPHAQYILSPLPFFYM